MKRYNLHNMKNAKLDDTLNFDNINVSEFEKENNIKVIFDYPEQSETAVKELLVKYDIIGFKHSIADFFGFKQIGFALVENALYSDFKELIQEGKANLKHHNIIEIYPQKFMNSYVLDKLLLSMQSDFELVKIHNNLIRAFKR